MKRLNQPGDVIAEVWSLENNAGNILEFNSETYALKVSGTGTPPVEYVTKTSYLQDGATPLSLRLGVRALSLELYNTTTEDKEAYWDLRRELVNFLYPEIGKPLTLSLSQPNGETYSIEVYPDPGIDFTRGDQSAWDIQETLPFKAFNPLWYKSTLGDITPAASQDDELVFPITFPIVFGSSGTIFNTGALNYNGSWRSYPIITLQGPYTSCSITLVNKAVGFSLLTEISSIEQRIIDTDPANLSIVDQDGNSKFDELSLPSNLRDFYIPAYPDGALEQIKVTMINGSIGTSSINIQYKENYLGI